MNHGKGTNKKALYDAGVAQLIERNGGLEKTLLELERTKLNRTKKQNFDLREKVLQIGNNPSSFYLDELL